MRKALVVGGAGFLGSEVARSLVGKEYDVVSFDLAEARDPVDGVEYILGDVRDAEALARYGRGTDIIFHMAGLLGTSLLLNDIPLAVDVNIRGGVNVLELAKESGAVMLNPGLIPQWDSPYMVTKNTVQSLGRIYHENFGTDVRTVQLSHAYGPAQNPYQAKAVPNFIIKALLGEDIVLFGKEGGAFKFMDLIYSADAGEAIVKIAENPALTGIVMQLGSGTGVPVDELARKIVALTNSRSMIVFKPGRGGEPEGREESFRHVDLSEWHRYFENPPAKRSLDEGLELTIAGYEQRIRSKLVDASRIVDG